MAKFDVESAYRNVSVYSNDCYLLSMKWQGKYFIDLALPFGLRSAPFIFSSVADLLEWIDFHTLGPPNSLVCHNNLGLCICLFGDWGIPLHPDKLGLLSTS